MEQVQQLLEILKQTPQMALWGLSIYFLFILIKLASWIFALKVVLQQLIKRYFDYKDKYLQAKKGFDIVEMFEKQSIDNVDYGLLIDLIQSAKRDPSGYIHRRDIVKAIEKLKS